MFLCLGCSEERPFVAVGAIIVVAYSFFARLAQDYVETVTTAIFVTLTLLAISAVIVVFMMHSTPCSWTDYGFTLKNRRSAFVDTLLKTGSFIVGLTILKWAVTLAGLAPTPVFSFPFFRRYPVLFALTYSVFCILQEIILRSAVQHLAHAIF